MHRRIHYDAPALAHPNCCASAGFDHIKHSKYSLISQFVLLLVFLFHVYDDLAESVLVPLQGAAVSVQCALWSLGAGADAGCRCRMPLQEAVARCL